MGAGSFDVFDSGASESLLDIGAAQSGLDAQSAALGELAERLLSDEPEKIQAAKNAASHHLRLLFVKQKVSASKPVTSETLKIVFSKLGSEIESLMRKGHGFEPQKQQHYRLLQEIGAIKFKRYSAAPGTKTSEETVQEINSALEVHLEFMKSLLGKKAGEFMRELEAAEKSFPGM